MLRSNDRSNAGSAELEEMEKEVAAMTALPIEGLVCGWTDDAGNLDFACWTASYAKRQLAGV